MALGMATGPPHCCIAIYIKASFGIALPDLNYFRLQGREGVKYEYLAPEILYLKIWHEKQKSFQSLIS